MNRYCMGFLSWLGLDERIFMFDYFGKRDVPRFTHHKARKQKNKTAKMKGKR